eukprot:6484684-Amphidinium_carterae.1
MWMYDVIVRWQLRGSGRLMLTWHHLVHCSSPWSSSRVCFLCDVYGVELLPVSPMIQATWVKPVTSEDQQARSSF